MYKRWEVFSKGQTLAVVLLLFISCVFLSTLIPPMMTPDEHSHVQRAYFLSKGMILLDQPEGLSSGGPVDTGLDQYLGGVLNANGKVSAKTLAAMKELTWTGQMSYGAAPGTGYYFPAIYLPQTLGLMVGESFELTIDQSYRLARAFGLVVSSLLIFAAFRMAAPSPLVLALLAMPMTLHQFSSASLDGISIALAVFATALFVRISREQQDSPNWRMYVLALSIAVLASSRIHTLPMLLLLPACYFYTRKKQAWYLFAAASVFVLGWTLLAMKVTVDLRVVLNESTSNVVMFYVTHPLAFAKVVWDTITDLSILNFYYRSFIGILGWLDTPFSIEQYALFFGLILAVAVLTVSPRSMRNEASQRLWLAGIVVVSILFVFFALLVTWTPHPATRIEGVQGRYFLIPALTLAYVIANADGLYAGRRNKLASALTLLLLMISVSLSSQLLIQRYYVSYFEMEEVAYAPPGQHGQMFAAPLHALTPSEPLSIKLPPLQEQGFGAVQEIGVLLGTYGRRNAGTAELVLYTQDGQAVHREFALENLRDNSYTYFEVPTAHYISGEIRAVSGGGVTIFDSRSPGGEVLTCTQLRLAEANQVVAIEGCR